MWPNWHDKYDRDFFFWEAAPKEQGTHEASWQLGRRYSWYGIVQRVVFLIRQTKSLYEWNQRNVKETTWSAFLEKHW